MLHNCTAIFLGTRPVYVCGQLIYSLGMVVLAATSNIIAVFVASLTAGFMYATLFTLPYILVARYHFDVEVRLKAACECV